jgi:thioredoxin 1
MMVPLISSRDFTEKVLRSREPVLLACRASWCAPSQQLVPIIERVASEYSGRVTVFAVDVETENPISRRLGVKRLPVTMMISDGKVVDFIGGLTDEKNISDMVAQRLKPVIEVGENNFDVEVLRSSVPTLVLFGSAACEASLRLIPVLRDIGERYRYMAKVTHVEFGPQTAQLSSRYGIVRAPTTALFVNGVMEDQILGASISGTKGGFAAADNIADMLDRFVLAD